MSFSSKYIITLRYFSLIISSFLLSNNSAGVLTVVLLYWRKTRWVRVGQVTELLLFPLKGGQALPVSELECGVRGPRRGHILDRGFMIGTEEVRILRIMSNGHVMFQGEAIDYRVKYNKVVLIRLSPLQNGWWKLEGDILKSVLDLD